MGPNGGENYNESMKYIENYYKKQQEGQQPGGNQSTESERQLMQGYQQDSCTSNQDGGQLVQTPIAQQPVQENASNLQNDTPVVINQVPDTTSVVPSQSGLQTTQIVESKRTGEGNWDEEIEDEVYFQYPDEEQTSINNNDAP